MDFLRGLRVSVVELLEKINGLCDLRAGRDEPLPQAEIRRLVDRYHPRIIYSPKGRQG